MLEIKNCGVYFKRFTKLKFQLPKLQFKFYDGNIRGSLLFLPQKMMMMMQV